MFNSEQIHNTLHFLWKNDGNSEYNKALQDVQTALDLLKESLENKDLVKAAINAADEDMQGRQIIEASNDDRQRYSRIFRRGFKAGVNWQEQQMMKDAVDGTFLTGEYADGTPIDAIFNFDKVVGNKYEEGEKVKIIVIKK